MTVAEPIITANSQPDVELLLDLARAYTQCSMAAVDDPAAAASFRGRALEWIDQAVKSGHRDPVYLEHEPDLAPLRCADDFLALIGKERQGADR